MKQSIKQRINQLNNGEIPNGYKKTEFGVFPCDWETKQLAQLLDFKNGINADKEKYNSGINMISVNDILTDRPIVYDSIQGQVDVDEDALKEYGVTYGDILFQRSSETFEDSGKANVYLDPDRIATYSGFVIRGKKKAEYEPYYLNEALRIRQVRKQIIRHAAGSQHINVGQDSLASVTIPFASSQEQSKIAEILMKWDEAIELNEQYIKKLEQREYVILRNTIKTFFGEKKKIKDCVTYHPSNILIKSLKEDKGGYPVYGANDIAMHISTFNFDCDAVAIIKYGSSAGKVSFLSGKHSVLGTMAEMIPKENINIKYMYYVLKCFDFKRYIEISTTPNVYFDDYSEEKIPAPSKERQDEIVKKLDTIAQCASFYKEKLELIKAQRKALQQYLLNGIVRVNV